MTKILLLFTLLFSSVSFASEDGDLDSLKKCLKSWGTHPFKTDDLKYRTIAPKVKVFGIGGDSNDDRETAGPDLVLIKPSVNVFTKGTMNLMNPNGWYCIKGKVAVFSKVEINLHCKANLAASSEGATVLGSNENNDGVTVFGKSKVKRTCHRE